MDGTGVLKGAVSYQPARLAACFQQSETERVRIFVLVFCPPFDYAQDKYLRLRLVRKRARWVGAKPTLTRTIFSLGSQLCDRVLSVRIVIYPCVAQEETDAYSTCAERRRGGAVF